jgi:polyhydroxybutyrate depolymerase
MGSGRDAARLSGLSAEADRSGFLVAYPDGIDGHWNDGRHVERYRAQREGVDDVGFLVALIDHLAGRYAVDRTRVYVTGASNGALMANRLACEHAERFAAIAPVIGSMARGVAEHCEPARTVPVLLINGTDDRLVPWNGEAVRFAGRDLGRILPLPELVRFWVRHNGCASDPEVTPLPDLNPDDGTRVVVHRYNACRDGASVLLYEVQGGGHTWPRGRPYMPQWIIGRTSQDLDANAAIWAFFAAHPRQP